ncbi:MAG: carbon starvation protein A, partial [Candidatus Neomarinimicrobiota bacterium]
YNIEELSRSFNVKVFQNRFISTIVAVVAIGYFALMKLGNKPVGLILWKLFGSTNQLLAALGLMVITVYLVKKGKPFVYSFIPMLFLFVMTLWAIVTQIKTFWSSEERAYPLIILSVVIVMLSVWMITEAAISVRRKNLSEMRRKSH